MNGRWWTEVIVGALGAALIPVVLFGLTFGIYRLFGKKRRPSWSVLVAGIVCGLSWFSVSATAESSPLQPGSWKPIAAVFLAYGTLVFGILAGVGEREWVPPLSADADPKVWLSRTPCKGCDRLLRKVQVEIMLGNSAYQPWCREGYCSLSCYEAIVGQEHD